MDVDPELLLRVIPHTLVLLMKTIKSARHDVVLGLNGRPVKFDPLTLLDKFEDVGPGADTVG